MNPAYDEQTFTVSVSTEGAKVYGLEYKTSLTDPQWTPLPLVAGDGKVKKLIDNTGKGGQRFYRVGHW
jgi:hypothetical protein